MSKPTYSEGRVHVLAEKCSTCIFRPGNLMTLKAGRVKDMVDGALSEEGGSITCHKTLPGMPGEEQQAICRGFYDAHADRADLLILAQRLGIIEEVPAP